MINIKMIFEYHKFYDCFDCDEFMYEEDRTLLVQEIEHRCFKFNKIV